MDISPRYAGILMSLTNASANMAGNLWFSGHIVNRILLYRNNLFFSIGLLAPITCGYIIEGKVTDTY